ncbi:hypothetical protein KU599_07885 [Salmonella enterica subsp. enterica serovar Mbandaka]|nr:hypothetical protein [Salmonella enterica subsp. enterica serovar Mbandaka]
MAKVLVLACMSAFDDETHFHIDNMGVVESIDKMNTFVRDNRDQTLGIYFKYFFTINENLNFDSSIEDLMQELKHAEEINYALALLILCNKVL